MDKLSEMPNLGKVLENKLIEVGITTPEQLIQAGSREAFLRIRNIDDSACYNMLCALEGAIQGIRWHNLSSEKKIELKEFVNRVG
ncbi:MAG: TfoX/Sxy family protein [Bacillota bacterium]|nr:TfoX/Sxy family protein [Bacillota bacterium]